MRPSIHALPWVTAAVSAAVTAAVLLSPVDFVAWWAGEVDLSGNRVFDPPAPQAANIARVDFELVHAELWPAWVGAVPGDEEEAYQRLAAEVAPDPYLSERVTRIHALVRDPARNLGRLVYQVWAWNRYCDLAGVHWRLIPGAVLNAPGDAQFWVKSYQVLSDTPTLVGHTITRTRVIQRVDNLSRVDGFLGLTSDHEEGAVVVAERVAAFAQERIWSLLDPALDRERTALDLAFAPAIREAAAQVLYPTDVLVLTNTAEDRFYLERAISAVHDRASCGNPVRIAALPFDGLHHRDLAAVGRYAAETATSPCPDVTTNEAVVFTLRSQRLQAAVGLRQALEALTAWVARAIAVHEARHAADDAIEGGLQCPGCPSEIHGVTRLEASAYLASFTQQDIAPVAMLQACAVEQVNALGRAQAIQFLEERLGADCADGPPADLAPRARALQRELFGHDDVILLSEDFPALLPLERAIR